MKLDKKMLHRLFALAAVCILLTWVLLDTQRAGAAWSKLWSLFSPFVVGAGVAFVINVPMRSIEQWLGWIPRPGVRRATAIVLTLLCFVLLLLMVIDLLVPQVQQTVIALSEKFPAFAEKIAEQLAQLMEEHPSIGTFLQEAFHTESIDWSSILQNAASVLGDKLVSMVGNAVTVISSVTGALVNMAVGFAFAMYCLARKEILARQGRRLLYAVLPEKHADEIIRILRLTNRTFYSFIAGQCLEACILGCLFAVVMAILRMPYIPLVSVLIAVTALVPVVGAFVGCALGAFFILVDSPVQAAAFVVMFLVLQQLENNLIYPRVVGTSIGLPGMWVLVAVTVGGELFGVAGMLLMIPLTSVGYTLLREFTNDRLAALGIPEEKLRDHPPEIRPKFSNKQLSQPGKLSEKIRQLLNAKKKI